MLKIGLVLVALVVGVHAHAKQVKLPWDYGACSRVARCESGGWVILGSAYPNSLGITRRNYLMFGGRPQTPTRHVSIAQRVAQIKVADRLIRYYHAAIPDHDGCGGAW